MKLQIKANEEQLALIKDAGSRDSDTSKKAVKILANLVGNTVRKVLDSAPTIDTLYTRLPISEYEPRTIPLDDYYDVEDEDFFSVMMQTSSESLAYNLAKGADDIPVQTFQIHSAIAMYQKYLRAGRISHVENGIKKLINEVITKLEYNAIQPILKQLADAQSNGKYHVISSQTADKFVLKDFNRLETLISRIIKSGTGYMAVNQEGAGRSLTSLLVSPEIVEEIRGFAYEPMNTTATPDTSESTAMPAPEALREQVYRSAGIPEIYGVNIIQHTSLGVGEDFNTFFDTYAGSNTYEDHGGSGTHTFSATDEILIGMNNEFDGLLKPVITDGETGEEFNVFPDDQFAAREQKVGYYGSSEQGYISVDKRMLVGMIV